MKPRGISVRARQILAIAISILVLGTAALIFLDVSHRLDMRREMLEQQTLLTEGILLLNQEIYSTIPEPDAAGHAGILDKINQLENSLLATEADSLLLQQCKEAILLLKEHLREVSRGRIPWETLPADLELITSLVDKTSSSLTEREKAFARSIRLQVALTFFLGIFASCLLLGLNTRHINEALRKMQDFTRQMGLGKTPEPLHYRTKDEFETIAENLNLHAEQLQEKIHYINDLAGEGKIAAFSPGEEDQLGNSLLKLSRTLTSKDLEEVTRNREDKKQNWISEGTAQMGEVLRSRRENLEELSYSVVQKLVMYMNIEMGALYIATRVDDHDKLRLMASHAYDRRKFQDVDLDWGAGLPGTCAREKKRIFLTDVPEDYFEISSGTGSSRPNCILLVPLLSDNAVYGVIELATVRLLKPFEVDFVESLAESIASSLYAVQANERTSELLKQSQAQAEVLKSQEKAMKESMKQLEEAQEESTKKESEITGILEAINHSVLVAELGVNRRYLSMNDNFLQLLGTQKEMVLGKLHSDLAMVDPYTDDYKVFWKDLQEGNSKANTEAYRIIKGKEIWLRQSFTPVLNSKGKVHKILNIATDITETRMLQEHLRERDAEIGRSQLDMQSMNRAVNTALIKAEMDGDAIIMEVNEKYSEISGFSGKEVQGRNMRLFLKSTEKDQFEKIWEEVLKGKTWEGVVRRSRPTGEEIWMASTFSPVKDENGSVIKVYFMGFDITEKKLKYQLLEDANKEIERLKESLNENEN